jgi:hypothetical protein
LALPSIVLFHGHKLVEFLKGCLFFKAMEVQFPYRGQSHRRKPQPIFRGSFTAKKLLLAFLILFLVYGALSAVLYLHAQPKPKPTQSAIVTSKGTKHGGNIEPPPIEPVVSDSACTSNELRILTICYTFVASHLIMFYSNLL